MMTPVIDGDFINPSAVGELRENNCTMPNIDRVIYSLKTEQPKYDADGNKLLDENGNVVMERIKPILTTTVYFIDNTRVVVQNSSHDEVITRTETLEDGSTVEIATEAAKENGLVYAIVKRYVGKVLSSGDINGNGLGRILRDIVADAYDCQLGAAKLKISRAKAKAAHLAKLNAAKSKPKNPSLLQTAIALADSQKELAECIKMLRADLNELKAKQG